MSEVRGNRPSHPVPRVSDGMTVREFVMTELAKGILAANNGQLSIGNYDEFASGLRALADALIKAAQ